MKLFIILAVCVAASLACKDEYSQCSRYGKHNCSHSWLKTNCKQYCGLCPTACKDVYSRCSVYSKSMCSHDWLKTNCKNFCGLCGTTPTQAPTQPPRTQPPNTQAPSGQCGRPQVTQSRVVGGKTANAHSWPWQIGLQRNGGFMCGGSIINNKWIVTAAHCVHRRSASDFTVKLGDHNRRVPEGEQTIQVKRIITHPGYGRLNNDIALLELSKPAMFGKHVQPVCLPNKGDKPAVGSTCFITGWGKIRHPGGSTHILQQLGLKVQTKADCTRMNSKYAPVTDQMLCAANPKVSDNQSGCHGDSGGPFVCQSSAGSWTLHGAVSWGSPRCDIKDSFTVFARVAEFRDWIDGYVQ